MLPLRNRARWLLVCTSTCLRCTPCGGGGSSDPAPRRPAPLRRPRLARHPTQPTTTAPAHDAATGRPRHELRPARLSREALRLLNERRARRQRTAAAQGRRCAVALAWSDPSCRGRLRPQQGHGRSKLLRAHEPRRRHVRRSHQCGRVRWSTIGENIAAGPPTVGGDDQRLDGEPRTLPQHHDRRLPRDRPRLREQHNESVRPLLDTRPGGAALMRGSVDPQQLKWNDCDAKR